MTDNNEPQLTEADAERMIQMRRAGLTFDEIARVYSVTPGTVFATLRTRMPPDELGAAPAAAPMPDPAAAPPPLQSEPAAPTQPVPAYQRPEPHPPRRRRHIWRYVIAGLAIGAVIGITAGVATSGGGKTPAADTHRNIVAGNTYSPAGTVTDPAGGTCPASSETNGYCPGDSPPPATSPSPAATTPPAPPPASAPSPAAPAYTLSQQQAIDSAQNYLSVEPGWSYLGLIGQLDSSAVGFSQADATVAVNAIAPAGDNSFWNAQAVDSAQNYMTTEPGWSACGLVQQLDSQAVQFTQAQAEYAVQTIGLGSC